METYKLNMFAKSLDEFLADNVVDYSRKSNHNVNNIVSDANNFTHTKINRLCRLNTKYHVNRTSSFLIKIYVYMFVSRYQTWRVNGKLNTQ